MEFTVIDRSRTALQTPVEGDDGTPALLSGESVIQPVAAGTEWEGRLIALPTGWRPVGEVFGPEAATARRLLGQQFSHIRTWEMPEGSFGVEGEFLGAGWHGEPVIHSAPRKGIPTHDHEVRVWDGRTRALLEEGSLVGFLVEYENSNSSSVWFFPPDETTRRLWEATRYLERPWEE